jgi:hypothetical protein
MLLRVQQIAERQQRPCFETGLLDNDHAPAEILIQHPLGNYTLVAVWQRYLDVA